MSEPVFQQLWVQFLAHYAYSGGYAFCCYCLRRLDPADDATFHDDECIIGRVQTELLKVGALKGQLRLLPRKA